MADDPVDPNPDDDPDPDHDGDPTPPAPAPAPPRRPNPGEGGAVAALRAAQRAATDRARTLERENADLRTRLGTVDVLRNSLLEQAVYAQAVGLLADPGDAMRMLDLADLSVGDDGKVDTEKIKTRLDDLVKSKPYLAKDGGRTRPPALPGGGQVPAPAGGFNDFLRSAIRG